MTLDTSSLHHLGDEKSGWEGEVWVRESSARAPHAPGHGAGGREGVGYFCSEAGQLAGQRGGGGGPGPWELSLLTDE